MITEVQPEQFTIQWLQDMGWSYANGADLAPEDAKPERANIRALVLKTFASAVRGSNP